MSPRLLPPTWSRHLVPALLAGAAGLVGWGVALVVGGVLGRVGGGAVLLGDPDHQAALLLGLVAALAGGCQVVVEGRFERAPLPLRWVEAPVAAGISGGTAAVGVALWEAVVGMDDATLALRERVAAWILAGIGVALGPLAIRAARRVGTARPAAWRWPDGGARVRWAGVGVHLAAGVAGGLIAAVAWYGLGIAGGDRHVAAAVGCWALGAVPGLLCWAVPARLLQGWVRVVRGARPGARVLVAPSSPLQERFIGHHPVSLDLHLPASDGVAELHASVLARSDGTFACRGLSCRSVRVRRAGALGWTWVDLTWDPASPAPLEVDFADGDLIALGDAVLLELVLAPREAPA